MATANVDSFCHWRDAAALQLMKQFAALADVDPNDDEI
jgi:hypothetical protein